MEYLKKIGTSLLYVLVSFLVLSFIVTLLNYINIIANKPLSVIKIMIPIISLLIGGLNIGQNTTKKGWLEGIKLSIIIIIIIILINLIGFNNTFKIKHLLFYFILIISSITGSMLGINLKNHKK